MLWRAALCSCCKACRWNRAPHFCANFLTPCRDLIVPVIIAQESYSVEVQRQFSTLVDKVGDRINDCLELGWKNQMSESGISKQMMISMAEAVGITLTDEKIEELLPQVRALQQSLDAIELTQEEPAITFAPESE